MEGAGQGDIRRIERLTRDQPGILPPPDPLADGLGSDRQVWVRRPKGADSSAGIGPDPCNTSVTAAYSGADGGRVTILSALALPSGSTAALARLSGVSHRYGDVLALDRLDLEVREGEVLAVLGPNGAGKTWNAGLQTGTAARRAARARKADRTGGRWPMRHLASENPPPWVW